MISCQHASSDKEGKERCCRGRRWSRKNAQTGQTVKLFFWHFVVSYVFFHCSSIWSWLHLYCLHSIVPCLHSMSQILSAIFCSPPQYISISVFAHNEKTSKADFTLLIFPSKHSVQFYFYSADLERLQSSHSAHLSAAHLHTSHTFLFQSKDRAEKLKIHSLLPFMPNLDRPPYLLMRRKRTTSIKLRANPARPTAMDTCKSHEV